MKRIRLQTEVEAAPRPYKFFALLKWRCLLPALALAALRVDAAESVAPIKKQADGVLVPLPSGVLRLQVWSDNVIRVTFAPGKSLPTNQSWSVIGAPAKTKWALTQTPETVTVETRTIRSRADKQT